MELLARLLEAVGASPMRRAHEAHVRLAARGHEDGAVGMHALAGELVHAVDEHARQAPPVGLVGHRRIGETVAQHHGPSRQRGRDDLRHQLRAGGLVDEQLGLVGHAAVRRVQHHGAQLLAHLGAAGLAQAQHLAAVRSQRLGQKADMRRLAGALAALERDEDAAQGIGCLCGFVYHGYGRSLSL